MMIAAESGRHTFESIGCAVCHVRHLDAASDIYSDLLLHDMGPVLADRVSAPLPPPRVFRQVRGGPVRPDGSSGGGYSGGSTPVRPTSNVVVVPPSLNELVAATQEFFPHKARKWFEGSRVKFRLDDQVPFGACHHQKVVVIDDRLAFCGGGDIGVDRWDTPGHLDVDLRRMMPDQECHAPRHEVMAMVDGEAAMALAEHFRARWQAGAADDPISPPPDAGGDPWPDHVPAHLTDVRVSVARTTPSWRRCRVPITRIGHNSWRTMPCACWSIVDFSTRTTCASFAMRSRAM